MAGGRRGRTAVMATSLVIVAGVAAAGCGGSSPSGTVLGSSSSDVAAARAINLVLSDFPSGWKSTPAQAVGHGAGFQEFLSCLHVADPTANQTADVPSANFSNQQGQSPGLQASSEVMFNKTAAQAQNEFSALSGPNVPGCFESALSNAAASASQQGATPSFKVTAVTPPPAAGNPATAYQANITLQTQGQTIPGGDGTLVFFVRGRALVEFNTLGVLGQTFPANLQAQLLSTLGNRANASKAASSKA